MGRGPVGAPALVKYNDQSISAITEIATSAKDSMVLIKTLTADGSGTTLSFVNGASDVVLDNTYPIYLFKFIGMHPATDNVEFQFNFSIDTGSNYNVTKTTTATQAYHNETDTETSFGYSTAGDHAQATGFQRFTNGDNVGNDNDQNISGELWLFNPSSTTFVKHFMGAASNAGGSDFATHELVAGYCNTTSAVDAAQFATSSGNIDAGTIKLYGIKDS